MKAVHLFTIYSVELLGPSSEWNAGTAHFFEGAVRGESSSSEIVLEHHAKVVSAASVAADCINPVGRYQPHPPAPVLSCVAEAAAHPRVPAARLFEAIDVVHQRGRCHCRDVPLFRGAKWDRVKAVGETEVFG